MSGRLGSKLLQVRYLFDTHISYARGLELQEALAEAISRHALPDQLLLLEHTPVYTVGKRGSNRDFHATPDQLAAWGATVHSSPRGGETTFHGPGQLVAYPIINLRQRRLGARAYVEGLEDALVDTLASYHIAAKGRIPSATGVWVGDRKIAAVGVRISRGVATHGVALNVSTDLAWFRHIVPCGAADKAATSMAEEGRHGDTPASVAPVLAAGLAHQMGYETLEDVSGQDL